MTVENTYEPIKEVSNGVVKNFSFNFSIENEENLVVYYDTTEDFKNPSVLSRDQYTVIYSATGGIIQFNTAPAAGYILIVRETLIEQPVSYKTTSGFDALVIEESFDKLTRINQELKKEIDKKADTESIYTQGDTNDLFVSKEDFEEIRPTVNELQSDVASLKTTTSSLETQTRNYAGRILPLEINVGLLGGRMDNLEEKVEQINMGNSGIQVEQINTVLDRINGEVLGTTNEKLSYLENTKEAIKQVIVQKGVNVLESDSFRSYANKIAAIKPGGEVDTARAYMPVTFKGSTALGSTILINPMSYYQSVTSDYESQEYSGDYSNNVYAIPLNNMIAYYCKYGGTNVIVRNENGSYPKNLNQPYSVFSSTVRLATQLIPDALIIFDINYTYLCTYDPQTNSLVSTQFTDARFARGRVKTLSDTVGEAPIFLDKNANIMYTYSPYSTSDYDWYIASWDLSNYASGPVKMNGRGNNYAFSTTYQGLFLPDADKTVAYVLSNGDTYKITNLTGPGTRANSYRVYIGTNKLTSVKRGTQTLDGLYSFIIADNAFWIYKRHQNTEEDYYYWEYDEEKTTFFTEIIGNYLGESRYYFLPQIDDTVYVQVNDFVFGFQYHPESDTFEQIEHPCAAIIEALPAEDKGNGLLYTYVNKVNGLASVSKKNNTSGLASVMTFSIDEKPNLENIHWVAYEPKRTNYIPQSVTAISNGTTGTDENGNPYVDVTYVS